MHLAKPKSRSLCWLGAAFLLLLGSLHSVPLTASDAPPRAEAESVKAVMTSIILRGAQWPDSAFKDATSNFQIGIIGKNPPFDEFVTAFEGVTISGRAVSVVSLNNPIDAQGFQAVYFSEMSESTLEQTLTLLEGKPTISIGDHDDFFKLGGIVNYRNVSGKLRFEFNRKSMETSGVKVSAQVIRLALPTKEEEGK